jgi:hypothetical protein
MQYIMNGEEPWIACTCKADLPNTNLHSNIQRIECQTEPDLAAVPVTILENPKVAVAALIKIPEAGHRAAAAAMIIKSWEPVAWGLTPMTAADNGTNLGPIMAATRAQMASR